MRPQYRDTWGIVTEYRGPTPSTGSRIIARFAAGHHRQRVTYRWDHSRALRTQHRTAAEQLAAKVGMMLLPDVPMIEIGPGTFAHAVVPGE